MRFVHQQGVTGGRKRHGFLSVVLLLISLTGLSAGIYILLLVFTPKIPVFYPVQEINVKALEQPDKQDNKIYIPKIGVNVALNAGDAEALETGAWHRFPERGDPLKEGNFIISAHRFSMGLTPGETRTKSPFYHIDKLQVGDQILVDYNGKRYGYEITKRFEVKPSQTEIEAEADEARMTLYTCTLKGESDGREVFYAKPLGEVVNGMVEKSD
jgi:sortase A